MAEAIPSDRDTAADVPHGVRDPRDGAGPRIVADRLGDRAHEADADHRAARELPAETRAAEREPPGSIRIVPAPLRFPGIRRRVLETSISGRDEPGRRLKLRRTVVGLFLVVLAVLLRRGGAEVCTSDNVPAATLLLPYFEVQLDTPRGLRANPPPRRVNTLLTVNNTGGKPHRVDQPPIAVLAHVVIWSDLSVPVLDFNIYLTSYDVQSINLYDILVLGKMPQTASAGQDPSDLISPQGPRSADVNFASCNGQLPPPDLPPLFLAHVQAALTGRPSALLGGLCAGRDLGDNIARGYVTIDAVNNCTLRLPSDPSYFSKDLTDNNTLWGDYFYVDTDQDSAAGGPLVHVEASAADPRTTTPGRYTFYGRYVSPGWNASDHREPLSTHFAVRYATGGTFSGGTSLAVWRDSKVNQVAFACPAVAGVRPAWYPLGQEGIVIFDEQENANVPASFPFSPQPPQQGILPFPAEAQRTQVGGPDFPVPFNFGWLYLDLNTAVAAAGPNPPADPSASQAWVFAIMEASGHFSVGFNAVQLDSACAADHSVP